MEKAKYRLLYKDFLTKAATFSYDDGVYQDVFLTEILDKYGLKGTFNINSGLFGHNYSFKCSETKYIHHNRLSEEQIPLVYRGHEIAGHSLTHPTLTGHNKEFLDAEVLPDLSNLDRITGVKTVGFAYPNGPHDAFTDEYLKDKVLYARTIENSHSFEVPQEFVPLHPTVYHVEPEFVSVCKDYVTLKPQNITWLYIWGHSYEFSLDGIYDNFIKVCKLLSKQKDIWFATNRDIIHYVKCGRALREENDELINDSDCDIYVEYKGKKQIVPLKKNNI